MEDQLSHILKQVFGFEDFRPVQKQVIDSVISTRDTLAILPTGGGKSLCYQIPGLARPGICLVVSPLIALMKDQVDNLKAKGIKALPEIMIPLTGTLAEMKMQEDIVRRTAEKVFEERKDRIDYLVGTMIEVPRAALIADDIAQSAEENQVSKAPFPILSLTFSRNTDQLSLIRESLRLLS